MKKQLGKLVVILTILLIILPTHSKTEAATGYQGYAVYRDGVLGGIEWHAGLMDRAYSSNPDLPVTHAPGVGSTVKRTSWSGFLNGNNTYKGVYRPIKTPSSNERDLFVSLGRRLATENISYNLVYQMYYDTQTTGTWVAPSDITSMRCDGVIEYIYEWYNFKVYGNSTYWDITKNSFLGRDHHSGTAITPKRQVNYLSLVTNNTPTP